jgi:hypothetical protein
VGHWVVLRSSGWNAELHRGVLGEVLGKTECVWVGHWVALSSGWNTELHRGVLGGVLGKIECVWMGYWVKLRGSGWGTT